MGAVLPRPPTPSSMTLLLPVLATGSFIPVRLLMLELKCDGKVEHCLPGRDIRQAECLCHCASVTALISGYFQKKLSNFYKNLSHVCSLVRVGAV